MAHDTLIQNPQLDTPPVAHTGSRAARSALIVLGVPLLGAVAAFMAAILVSSFLPRAVIFNNADLRRAPNDALYDPLDYTYGLIPLEQLPDGTTYNRILGQAFFTYPYRANLGRYIHVTARVASGLGSDRQALFGTLYLNGQEALLFSAPHYFIEIEGTLDTLQTPNSYLDPTHAQIEIRSATLPDAEGNDVGMAIDWIRVESERDTGEIVMEAVVWAIVTALLAVLAVARLSAWRATLGVLALLATMSVVRLTYLPRAIPPWVEIVLVGLAWALAVWAASRVGRRWLWALPLAAGLLWLVVAGRMLGDWQMDDAYISYRYAWNLAHGQGLVYNPGEVVEGYTNFLWTVMSAGVIAVGMHPAGPMLALNIALSMGVVALSWRIALRLTGSYLWANVAALLLCVDGALASYGARGSGMEAMLFGFCALLALHFLWNGATRYLLVWRVLGGVSLALGALTRPEGLLVAGVLLAVRAWQDRARFVGAAGRALSWAGPSLASLAAFGAIVVPYQTWRILFYGWLFPNTFYAKTGATLSLVERGLIYTGYFVTERWLVIIMAIVGGILLLGGRRIASNGLVAAMAALIIPYTAYVLWAGGDYFPGWRFYVPVLAPLVLMAVWATHTLISRLPGRGIATSAALAILIGIIPLYCWRALWQQEANGALAIPTKNHNSYVNLWGSAGLWLREGTPPDSVTAAQGAGAIAYYSQRKVVDMHGLNDLHIGHLSVGNMGEGKAGHEKSDPAYVLNVHKPDYIYALWADYFDPVAGQLEQEYEYVLERSPTGTKIEWLRRIGDE